SENIVAEPAKRDTAAAIALGIGWVAARDPKATMAVLPADHLIQNTAEFQQTMRVAQAAAEATGELVTVGIKPTWACPGFGYIELGGPIKVPNQPAGPAVYDVVRFREKPDAELAETFLRQGNFRWNAGMFIWSIPAILSAFHRHAPELAEFIERLHSSPDFLGTLRDHFSALPKISIDYAIMEKASRVLMVESSFDWDDVGSWIAGAKYLKADAAGNQVNTTVECLESSGNIVFSESKVVVGLVGVRDLIVVQTGDALLICD